MAHMLLLSSDVQRNDAKKCKQQINNAMETATRICCYLSCHCCCLGIKIIRTCNISSIPAVSALFTSVKMAVQSVEAMANSRALIQNFIVYYDAQGWIEMIYYFSGECARLLQSATIGMEEWCHHQGG